MCGEANTLTLAVVQPQERTADATMNDMTTPNPSQAGDCEQLIQKFDVTRVSVAEAGQPRDCVVKLGADRRKRIDRQGPVKDGATTTHARFAVQLGTPIYAGIWMQVDQDFTIANVRAALRRSLTVTHGYVRLFKS